MKRFVHRYKFSHDTLRHRWKRKLKDGKARIISQDKRGWLYETIEQVKP